MKYPEAAYINAGYKYERANTPNQCAAASQVIRTMLEAERIDDRAEARQLIATGREEARR